MPERNNATALFREAHGFSRLWLWILFVLDILLIIGIAALSLLSEETDLVAMGALLVILVVFGCGLPVLFYLTSFVTEVRSDGIYFRFSLFNLSFRKIPFEQLRTYYARTYTPLREYGARGVRWGSNAGKAYDINRNLGVQLELSNGKRIWIRSKEPEGLVKAIDLALCKRSKRNRREAK